MDGKQKVEVPKYMLEAAVQATCGTTLGMEDHNRLAYLILEAGLTYQAAFPVVPTDEDMKALHGEWMMSSALADIRLVDFTKWAIITWQCRMFLETGPKFPEAIKDLMRTPESVMAGGASTIEAGCAAVNQDLMEAYRRGKAER